MKQKYKIAFIEMAEVFSKTSTAVRLKVGAILVKNDSIIAHGCNGMPPSWPTEVCEEEILKDEGRLTAHFVLVTKPECRHAEIAALEKLWKSPETSEGSVIFISHSPCKSCAIKLKTAGIVEVYYRTSYRSDEGIKYLNENGIPVYQL